MGQAITVNDSVQRRSVASRLGHVLVIGAGAMGSAVIAGLGRVEGLAEQDVVVCDRHSADAKYRDASSALTSQEAFDTVILAVRPSSAPSIANSLRDAAAAKDQPPLLISIMSGVSCDALQGMFGGHFAVLRAMPNTPLAAGGGMTLVASDSPAGEDAVELALGMFCAMGDAVAIPESLFNAGMALSGCGPAYFELVVDALARAGVAHGIPRAVANRLVIQTMRGTGDLLAITGKHPQAAIDDVTTPGGTTIAAVEAMEANGLRTALALGVRAAVQRAEGR